MLESYPMWPPWSICGLWTYNWLTNRQRVVPFNSDRAAVVRCRAVEEGPCTRSQLQGHQVTSTNSRYVFVM